MSVSPTTPDPQILPAVVSDGAGGAIISWADERGVGYDIFVQRLNGAGALQWPVAGVAITNQGYDQTSPAIISDGFGGAIMTWQDQRTGGFDIYAHV